MATRKTLESKVCEAGRERVSPLILTPVIRDMIARGELTTHPNRHAELLALPGTSRSAIKERESELTTALAIFHRYTSGSKRGGGVVGKAGEDMLEQAFTASRTMDVFNWGDEASRYYHGVYLDQPSDGLVIARSTVGGRSPIEHVALVEVKNRRDWVTADDVKPWKLIRNAYRFNVAGVYFARRIMRTAFWFTFKRVGAVGVETFNQFAPPESEADLAVARHKYGLGYHDLYFGSDVPKHLQKQVDALPERLMAARDRMNAVRHIVERYVDSLADRALAGAARKALFNELKQEVLAYDRNIAEEDDDDGDEEEQADALRDLRRDDDQYYYE